MKTQIIQFHETEIYCPVDENGTVYVAVKPICEALGISIEGQKKRILNDEILGQLLTLRLAVGRDDKQREMDCLPLQFIFGWLFSIDQNAVKPEAKETVLRYKKECYLVLYDHFFGNLKRINQSIRRENAILESIAKLKEEIGGKKEEIRKLETELDTLRKTRSKLNQLELFEAEEAEHE